jgi:diguanylate cyclase (GGDEF)-like protein/PAS domain S-box-containing protein
MDKTGKPAGFAVDVMNAIAAQSGLHVSYIFGRNWEELQQMLLSGKADLVPILVVNKERSKLFAFSRPMEVTPIAWMTRKSSPHKQYQPGLKTGVIRGSAAEDRLLSDQIPVTKQYNSLQEMLFNLLAGEVDLVLGPATNARRLASDAGLDDQIRIITPALFEAKRSIALRKDNGALLQQLNDSIDRFIGSKEYRQIHASWWQPAKPFWTTRKILMTTTTLLVLLGGGLVWWRYRSLKTVSRDLKTSRDELQQQTVSLEREINEKQRTQELLRTQERRIRLLLDSVAEGIIAVDVDGTCIQANPAALRLLGFSNNRQIVGRNFHQLCHHSYRDGSHYPCQNCFIARAMQENQPTHSDTDVFWKADGTSFDVEYWSHPMKEQDQLVGAVVAFTDISERRHAEAHILKLSHGLENSASAVLITDVTGSIEYVNAKFTAVTGYPPEEALGKNPRILKSENTPPEVFSELWTTILNGHEWRGELLNRRKNGEVYWSVASISPLRNAQGTITHFIANVEDVNDRKNAEATIEKLAYYDPLTGLPNRRLLQDHLSVSMKRCNRLGSTVALLYLDLDRFKHVNDSLGHQAGDKLLQQMAERFTNLLRDDDLVCRLGGDEFAIILHDIKRDERAAQVAEKLIAAAGSPVFIEGTEVVVTASIGIALYPKDADNAETLAKHADIALYHAKSEGKDTFRFYADELNRSSHERIGMEHALRHAVEKSELYLQYQPKICVATGTIMGAEALLRWQTSSYGTVSPDRFIPLAEETRLIIPIGKWVLRTACLQQAAWKQQGLDISMAVNLSAIQFNAPALIEQIASIIDETGIQADRLELELTESALVVNPESAVRILKKLRNLGVSIAIDDFGTGYSSLSYLKTFPVNVLKIDRSFVRDLAHDSGDRAIARSIVDLAENLGMKTVAEGVETEEQSGILKDIGCDYLQGFLYARPMSADQLQLQYCT